MTRSKHTHERGAISGIQVTVIGLAVLVLGLGSFGIWSFVSYQDAQSNVDSKIDVAVAEAKKEQADMDDEKFTERENSPTKTFRGPEDYCGLSFNYSKLWSTYVADSGTNGGDFEAYFHPDEVPPTDQDQQFALRVLIERKDYDDIIASYQALVSKGTLKSSIASSQGNEYQRLDGNFSKNIRGSAVIYKCRAYTITIRSDSDSFKPQFDKLVQTVTYNQ